MSQVLVSPKFQIIIPKEARRSMGIKPGQKLTCIASRGVLRYLPHQPIENLRGIIKKQLSLDDLREKDDRIV
jgi:AbrB family looped-hinge helix DNA binding protein